MIHRLVSNYTKISSKTDCKQVKVVNKGQSKMNKKLLMKAREKNECGYQVRSRIKWSKWIPEVIIVISDK